MSDGPHRSLPMRPAWKRIAECAANEAFAAKDVCDAVVDAVEKDCRKDISAGLVASIRDVLGRKTLFSEDTIQSLEDLRQTTSGSAVGGTLVDFVIRAIGEGRSGRSALQEAMINTLIDQSARCARQVEEHYLRKSSIENTQSFRQRVKEAIRSADFRSLADQILDAETKSIRRIKKQDGLDDGVKL